MFAFARTKLWSFKVLLLWGSKQAKATSHSTGFCACPHPTTFWEHHGPGLPPNSSPRSLGEYSGGRNRNRSSLSSPLPCARETGVLNFTTCSKPQTAPSCSLGFVDLGPAPGGVAAPPARNSPLAGLSERAKSGSPRAARWRPSR